MARCHCSPDNCLVHHLFNVTMVMPGHAGTHVDGAPFSHSRKPYMAVTHFLRSSSDNIPSCSVYHPDTQIASWKLSSTACCNQHCSPNTSRSISNTPLQSCCDCYQAISGLLGISHPSEEPPSNSSNVSNSTSEVVPRVVMLKEWNQILRASAKLGLHNTDLLHRVSDYILPGLNRLLTRDAARCGTGWTQHQSVVRDV